MKQKTFLEKLYELKAFLKEHPEQRIVYSDINVDFLIMKTKREANAVAMRTQTSSFVGGFPKAHTLVSLQSSTLMNCKTGLTIIPVRFSIICLQVSTRHS